MLIPRPPDHARQAAPEEPSRRQPTQHQPTQHGQALVEFTLFFLIMMLLLAGVTDIASLLDDHVGLVYAARQGARTGAVIGPVATADCAIVGAIHSALYNMPSFTLTQIIIYKAGITGRPAVDDSGGTSEQLYPGSVDCQNAQIINTQTGQVQAPLAGSNWDPSTRIATPLLEDSLGVELDFTYQWRFNLLGSGSFAGFDYATYPLDPST